MKKTFILGIILMCALQLFGIEIIVSGNKIMISQEKLVKYDPVSLETHLIKDGKPKDDKWIGVDLITILEEYNISDYDQIKFYSNDNYMVRLKKEDIYSHKPIIALNRNGKKIDKSRIRLVVPEMRDMFWISGIAYLETESAFELKFPHNIIFAEKYLADKEQHALAPFKDATGYDFAELTNEIFPTDKRYFVIGRDGVSHWFEYENYLSKAVLISKDNKFDMKSIQMPGGMWVDDIAAIVLNSKAIIFQNQFNNLEEVMELLKISSYHKNVQLRTKNEIKSVPVNLPFSEPIWQNSIKIIW